MNEPNWTDILQGIGTFGAFLTTIVGFLFLYFQVRQIERSIRSTIDQTLYEHNARIMEFLTNHPEMRKYFYDGVDIVATDPQYSQVLSVAEILACFMELVAMHRKDIRPDIMRRWIYYIREVCSTSPILRRHISDHSTWYAQELHDILSHRE